MIAPATSPIATSLQSLSNDHSKNGRLLGAERKAHRDLTAAFGDVERQQAVEPDRGEQQRPCRKPTQRQHAEAARRHRLCQPLLHRLYRFERELPIDAVNLATNGRDKRTGIGVRANRKLHVSAERVRNVVQHDIGKLAERLVGVNERLRAERPVGHVGHHANDREPGIRVLRYVEPPPQPLADGVLPGPEPLGEPLVDDDDARGVRRSPRQ